MKTPFDRPTFNLPPPNLHRKTKIVCTVGPACRSEAIFEQMILAGANVFRLNFSHGSHAEHGESFDRIRSVSQRLGIPVAILQDLSGPKIRITTLASETASITDGASVTLKAAKPGDKSDGATIFVEGLNPSAFCKPGHLVLLADGILALEVTAVDRDSVTAKVTKGGKLRSKVGIAFPDGNIDLPAATPKDFEDLAFGIEKGVDYAAVSFVNNARDMLMLREAILRDGGDVRLIAKIERRSALNNIEEISQVSDGLMVARGDLGLELALETLPNVQRQLIEHGNFIGIPVIVATQMMHSMITATRPTRAEVSDIAGAVMSGADAVMLSEETAIGEHPVECVKYIDKIVREAERSFTFDEFKPRLRDADRHTVPDSVAFAACAAANKINAKAIIACTETGTSARLVAKYRPQQPLYGVSRIAATVRRMALYWGIVPTLVGQSSSHDGELTEGLRAAKDSLKLKNGEKTVIIGGQSVGRPGSTSILEIREVRE
jgi:pyruvate kinase